ncbi:muramoyltetrapeptide carboxypeptidase [Paucibacter oligotrophus]|uniref:Muramoyltetrapeptide carboxypeptidase n=1 Tax=Roseateles oligotrophus TaxID=1769250 RepID=A0A840L9N8_9BURK|nr:LD-carboxypeptidase [Roseateles oligotrophus]MBB4843463.1 muramoyltetrapeptide carboxypeptidase [Roseateles oligotrophus]
MPKSSRRAFAAQSLAAVIGGATATLGHAAPAARQTRLPLLRPKRLQPGDTLGLIAPSHAFFEREPFALAIESLQALGFKVKEGQHLRARYGQFAGSDAQRAADVNAFFADDSVAGILALRGGSGCNRIVDKLDYGLIRAKPKFFGGFSDLTSLTNAMQAQTGLITFHSPMASSEWNEYSLSSFRAVVMEAQAALLRNPPPERGDNLIAKQDRIWTLRGGRARGPLVGGNLSVLASLAGSAYFPDCRGAVLFLEDVNEPIYKLDSCLSTLRLAGALDQLAGVALGAFSKCEPGEGYGSLTLDEVFDDFFVKPLKIPVYRGASFGHIRRKMTLPVGAVVEIDADAGSLQLLEAAVL